MTAKTAAERKSAERARRAAEGLTRLEVWARPRDHAKIKELAERLAKQTKEPR